MPYLEYNSQQNQPVVVTLEQGPITVGRDPGCDISWADKRISRHHSRLEMDGTRWFVVDLGSTNGTQLNGVKIGRQALDNNDIIAIGGLKLFFRQDGDGPEPSVVIGPDELTKVVSSISGDTQWADDQARRLSILLEISTALEAMGSTRELLERFAGAIWKMFHPNTCVVALREETITLPKRPKSNNDPFGAAIARIMARARKAKTGVIYDHSPAGAKSDPAPTAQMCVPIMRSGSMEGVLYLDVRNGSHRFVKDDLTLLTVIGHLISGAVSGSDKMARLDAENRMLVAQQGSTAMIGQSRRTREFIRIIETKLAPVETTVLLTGETGTGKSFAARALHVASGRSKGPFIKVNCAAIPDNLLESELFGYEKGAFSGAAARKIGQFEAAHNGTILLDEVGELTPSAQAKLLMVLQEKQLVRVGGIEPVKVSIRVVAATNVDLKEAVAQGRFRQDLFYRLNIVRLEIPPLRERKEDIAPLADHFLHRFCAEMGRKISGFDDQATNALERYSFPGNIRELSNIVERAVIFAEDQGPIGLSDLPDEVRNSPVVAREGHRDTMALDERALVVTALEQARGNKREAARILGWYPQKLYARLKKYDL